MYRRLVFDILSVIKMVLGGYSWLSFPPKQYFVSCNAILSFFFSDCCDSIEVYYTGPLEYTHTSIYGYYVRQEDLINERPWYKNDGRSIWWDSNSWSLGKTTTKGGSDSYAYLDNDGRCLPKIPDQKWKLSIDGVEEPAGNRVNIRCGYRPSGTNTIHK